MSRFSIDVTDVEKLAKEFAAAPAEKQKEARTVTQRVAGDLATRARAAAPRDRPWLATIGIHRKTWAPRDGVHVDVFTGMDERGVNVGFYVEYGTSDTPPQPFLGPATPAAQQELEAGLSEILDPFTHHDSSEVPD